VENSAKVTTSSPGTEPGVLGSFFFEYWPYLLIALAICLIVLLYHLVRTRRRKEGTPAETKKAAPGPVGADAITENKPDLPVTSLRKIWKGFLKELPWEVRWELNIYQHFIVLGDVGAGKSSLIDSHTDWQGYARQFYPSYTGSSLLRIYLASKILVQEIPSALLNDTSANARLALLKLWKPLYRRKAPTVVVVLNSMALKNDDPEYIEKVAQIIRGKINLLARIHGKPIMVRIALTHMDQVEGFTEICEFLTQKNIPLKLEFKSREDLNNLSRCLEPYEDLLGFALTALPADKYVKLITFMRKTPEYLEELSNFVSILQSPDPLSPVPQLAELCLASHIEGHFLVSRPFATTLTSEEIQNFNPLFRHQITAAALGLIGIVFMAGTFFYEKQLVEKKEQEIGILEELPPAQYGQKMHRLFIDPLTHMQSHTLMTVLPDFFPHINAEIDRRVIESIRDLYLLPELERLYVEDTDSPSAGLGKSELVYQDIEVVDAQQKVLYFLGLIYATRKNELGTLILADSATWAAILSVPELLITDYINNNQSSWPVDLDIDQVTYRQARTIAADLHSWMVYFSKVERLYQQEIISKYDFQKLQEETDHFVRVVSEIERFDLSLKVAELLKEQSIRGVTVDLLGRQNVQHRQMDIKYFLQLIKSSSFDYPEVNDDLNLIGLWEHIKVMLHFKQIEGKDDRRFQFVLADREFKFSSRRWHDSINRSKITLFLREFINHNKQTDGLLFFPAVTEIDGLVMNPFNDGSFIFTGHSTIDGRFTKAAFEEWVKPVLSELPTFVEQLPVPVDYKNQLGNFLLKEVEAYANQYAESYRGYYIDFDVTAQSPGAFRYLLTQLSRPLNPLMEFLLSVKENTELDLESNEYFRPLALRLGEFEFLQRLMAEQKGGFPELDKYTALLKQMQLDIQKKNPASAKSEPSKNQDVDSFTELLTPLGRINYAIYQDQPDSYLNLINLWLQSVGISAQWQDVFLAPAYLAYSLGKADVETELEKIWTDLWQAYVSPLYSRFPFSKTSDRDISPSTLRNATHPSGRFWLAFNKFLAPVCEKHDGRWSTRSGAIGELKLPDNMLITLDAIERLSAKLWTQDGEERPLELTIRPAPLPASVGGNIPVLSYLQAGEDAVIGFNQQPSWKTISFQWHTSSVATVGLEIITSEEEERMQRSLSVPKTFWSFFHLFQEAEQISTIDKFYRDDREASTAWSFRRTEGNINREQAETLSWLIDFSPLKPTHSREQVHTAKSPEGKNLYVKFDIQEDPWSLFSLPPKKEVAGK